MISFQYATTVCNLIATVSVVSALLVITVSNPVSSVLWLITSFVAVACYLVTAGMTYMGLSYVIVYVGAISILFLFVVMILNMTSRDMTPTSTTHTTRNTAPLAVLIVLMTAWGLIPLTSTADFTIPTTLIGVLNLPILIGISTDMTILSAGTDIINQWSSIDFDHSVSGLNQVQVLGITLYTSGAVWLILVSILLILAMLVPLALAYTGLYVNPYSYTHTYLYPYTSIGIYIPIPLYLFISVFLCHHV